MNVETKTRKDIKQKQALEQQLERENKRREGGFLVG